MQIQLSSTITSITAKVDSSIGMRLGTPELTTDEKAKIMELQNRTLTVTIEPVDEPSDELFKIDKELNQKTPSQRLRASLFVLWDQKYKKDWQDFEAFYNYQMNKMIENVKKYLE